MPTFEDIDFMDKKVLKREIINDVKNDIKSRQVKRPITIQITIPKNPSDVKGGSGNWLPDEFKKVEENKVNKVD